MSTQHTPGPWTIEGYRIFGPPDPRSKHKNGRMLVGGVVDELTDWRADPAESRNDQSAFAEETTANARLIAAAPELLAALEAAVELMPLGTGKRAAWFIDIAGPAIARAKGKKKDTAPPKA